MFFLGALLWRFFNVVNAAGVRIFFLGFQQAVRHLWGREDNAGESRRSPFQGVCAGINSEPGTIKVYLWPFGLCLPACRFC